jgi:hypothetical protein
MKIEAETWPGTCRYCGDVIAWVRRYGTTVPIAFDPPLVFAPTLFADDARELDRVRTKLHAATCQAFNPPLVGQARRHV